MDAEHSYWILCSDKWVQLCSMLSNSSASECMNFKVLWNFKDVNEGSSEIQAWQYLGVSPIGV